jgi:16S rRNA (cytosine967-C5)-methyltransferase
MTSREIALAASLRATERSIPLQDALVHLMEASALSPRDRAFAEQIALGALRRRITLDLVLDTVLTTPIARVQPPLAEALRQAAFQILILDRVPPHAAVHETVSLVKSRMGKGPSGLANAVLRALSALVQKKGTALPSGDESRSAIASTGEAYTILSTQLLPSAGSDSLGWLSGAFGYPAWMVARWLERFGRERTERILWWGNTPPTTNARLNSTRTSGWPLADEEAKDVFKGCSHTHEGEVAGTYRIVPERPPGELPGFRKGLFTIQDPTQVRPARMLAPAPGATVLDLCAGLGGKSLQLSEMVGEEGRVIALERDASKLALAREAAARLGRANLAFVTGDCLAPPDEVPLALAYIMLDAPCSNMGTLDRRPEVRFRSTRDALGRLAKAEAALLEAALRRLAPGGNVVYSVCSFEEEETATLVRAVLKGREGFTLQGESLVLPIAGERDGGYCARIARDGSPAE